LAEFKKGQMVKAKILDVDIEKERISLGLKQLTEDTVGKGLGKLKKGTVVTCTITAITNGGIEVLANDVPGFIRKGDLSRERSEQRPDRFAAGEKIDAKITQVDASGRKLTLSIKALEVEEEKKAMATYGSSDAGASLGDILGAAIQEKAAGGKDEEPARPAKKVAEKEDKVPEKVEEKAEEKPAKKEAKKRLLLRPPLRPPLRPRRKPMTRMGPKRRKLRKKPPPRPRPKRRRKINKSA